MRNPRKADRSRKELSPRRVSMRHGIRISASDSFGLRIWAFGLVPLFLVCVLAALALSGVLPVRAANPGDEVIVIYNTRVPESKGVADYYAERRHVPANQIFGFALSTNEDMSRAEFRDELQKPLAQSAEEAEALANRPEDRPAARPTTRAGWNGRRSNPKSVTPCCVTACRCGSTRTRISKRRAWRNCGRKCAATRRRWTANWPCCR